MVQLIISAVLEHKETPGLGDKMDKELIRFKECSI